MTYPVGRNLDLVYIPGGTTPGANGTPQGQPSGNPRYSPDTARLIFNKLRGMSASGLESQSAVIDGLVEEMGPNDDTPGILTHSEFNSATGLHWTEEFFNAVIGFDQGGTQNVPGRSDQYGVRDLRHLLSYIDQNEQTLEILGISINEASQWEDITIVPREALLSFMISMTNDNIRALLGDLNNSQLRRALQMLNLNGIDVGPGVDRERVVDAVVNGIISMQHTAQGSGPGAVRARHNLYQLGLFRLAQLNLAVESDNGFKYGGNGLSHPDLNLSDPAVAQRFLQTVFTSYLHGSSPSDGDLGRIEEFAEQVSALRGAAGSNVQLNAIIDNLDYGGLSEGSFSAFGSRSAEVWQALRERGLVDENGLATDRFAGSITAGDLGIELTDAQATQLSGILQQSRARQQEFNNVLGMINGSATETEIQGAIRALHTREAAAPPSANPTADLLALPNGESVLGGPIIPPPVAPPAPVTPPTEAPAEVDPPNDEAVAPPTTLPEAPLIGPETPNYGYEQVEAVV
ncbi:MAG: hypothetical protein ABIA67_04905 [Candidatus Margulisiibacteriota bacterium]